VSGPLVLEVSKVDASRFTTDDCLTSIKIEREGASVKLGGPPISIGRLVFTVEHRQTPYELFLLGHESRGENVIDDHMESPKLFERHPLKRLPFHEPPDSRIAHSLGFRGADGNSGLVARRVTYIYGADLVYGNLNDSTLTASGATELALIGFAGHLIQPFDI